MCKHDKIRNGRVVKIYKYTSIGNGIFPRIIYTGSDTPENNNNNTNNTNITIITIIIRLFVFFFSRITKREKARIII